MRSPLTRKGCLRLFIVLLVLGLIGLAVYSGRDSVSNFIDQIQGQTVAQVATAEPAAVPTQDEFLLTATQFVLDVTLTAKAEQTASASTPTSFVLDINTAEPGQIYITGTVEDITMPSMEPVITLTATPAQTNTVKPTVIRSTDVPPTVNTWEPSATVDHSTATPTMTPTPTASNTATLSALDLTGTKSTYDFQVIMATSFATASGTWQPSSTPTLTSTPTPTYTLTATKTPMMTATPLPQIATGVAITTQRAKETKSAPTATATMTATTTMTPTATGIPQGVCVPKSAASRVKVGGIDYLLQSSVNVQSIEGNTLVVTNPEAPDWSGRVLMNDVVCGSLAGIPTITSTPFPTVELVVYSGTFTPSPMPMPELVTATKVATSTIVPTGATQECVIRKHMTVRVKHPDHYPTLVGSMELNESDVQGMLKVVETHSISMRVQGQTKSGQEIDGWILATNLNCTEVVSMPELLTYSGTFTPSPMPMPELVTSTPKLPQAMTATITPTMMATLGPAQCRAKPDVRVEFILLDGTGFNFYSVWKDPDEYSNIQALEYDKENQLIFILVFWHETQDYRNAWVRLDDVECGDLDEVDGVDLSQTKTPEATPTGESVQGGDRPQATKLAGGDAPQPTPTRAG